MSFQVHGIDADGKVVTDEWLAEPLAVRIPAAGFVVWLKSLPRRGVIYDAGTYCIFRPSVSLS
jgi:hypothetical protein